MTGIGESFNDQEIFLTGANGFLGKIVLALLLDRLPSFKRLHLLMRSSEGLSARDRFERQTLSSPPVQSVVAQAESAKSRITVWPGDISQPLCGLAPEIVDGLAGQVSLIINCAGKVDFSPPLDESFRSNVDGVENVMILSRRLGAKLLHVSTCYVCGEADGLIEETDPVLGFYPHRRGTEDTAFNHVEEVRHARLMIEQIRETDRTQEERGMPRRSRERTQRLIALGKQRAANWGWVNTYTYSKSLGEQLLASAEGLEFAIVRPAIVESTWRFPFPGWIEGGRTAAPLVLMAMDGLKDWPVREDAPLEVVPVDMVASAILIVAALLLQGRHKPVYQLGSADVNPIELGEVVRLLDRAARKRARRNGNGTFAKNLLRWGVGRKGQTHVRFVTAEEAKERASRLRRSVARTERWIERVNEVMGKTGLLRARSLAGWKAELRRLELQAKFRVETLDQYLPFVLDNRYIFESENIRAAYAALSDHDRSLLPWMPDQIDWRQYWIQNQIGGVERWVQPEAVAGWTFKI